MEFPYFLQLPDSVLPLNNVAFAYNAMSRNEKGVLNLKKALKRAGIFLGPGPFCL
jgi:hypothetical protein